MNTERFEYRNIRKNEADQAAEIEQICFPPNEACSREHMVDRVLHAPELFLVAVDNETGKIAGFLNGLATRETVFRDAFFTDGSLHDPAGEYVMLLGLDVLPEYRRQGLARELVSKYAVRGHKNGRKQLILTCLKEKLGMYRKFGFQDRGISNSTWGGEVWYEMVYSLQA